ncbi:MAG: Hpt domain-containing protein [Nitrospiraceae bacterium]
MASDLTSDDDFQKELLELFVQEAQEWLQQIQAAMGELEGRPLADRRVQLVDTIVRGLTNLGGSAATVNLPEVEQATFALLPFLDGVRGSGSLYDSKDFAEFRHNLYCIAIVLGRTTGTSFDKELVELFAQEAREWLGQINAALNELGRGPATDRRAKLVETITNGLTNLGGSAATVDLPYVERATFSLLPFLESLRNPSSQTVSEDLAAFRHNLSYVTTALGKATGTSFEDTTPVETVMAPAVEPRSILHALRDLQRSQSQSPNADRQVVGVVIHRMEEALIRDSTLDAPELHALLDDLDGSDLQFLKLIHQQLPDLTQAIAGLRSERPALSNSDENWDETIHAVQRLREAAVMADAGPLLTFLSGLQAFVTIVTQRRIALAAKRIEAVESRLNGMMTMAQHWIEVRRLERAAIEKLLPT